jgi:hypothetical protein
MRRNDGTYGIDGTEPRPMPRTIEELVIEYGSAPPPRQKLDTRSKLIFERRVVEWFWPFAREEPHGHPPFYASVGPSGDLLTPSWEQLPQALLGPGSLGSGTRRESRTANLW